MIRIVESGKDFGSMNAGSIRFSNLTEQDKRMLCERLGVTLKELETYDLSSVKKELFARHREDMGETMGFDGNRMFMADQEHKRGTHFEISRDYVEANPKGWTDIPEDILVVTSQLPGVVIGHPVADCPVVMMVDRKQGISAIGHCSADMIDRRLPTMIVEVLRREYGSRADDIMTYVSASIGEGWTYDVFPKWARDAKVWDQCIVMGEDGLFHINMKPAIMMQLISSGLQREQILFNMDDTKSNPNYYSNSNSSNKDYPVEEDYGRHFAGMFFTDEDTMDVEIRKGRGR